MRFRTAHLLTATAVTAVSAWAAASCRGLYEIYGSMWQAIPLIGGILIVGSTPLLSLQRWRRLWLIGWTVILLLFCGRQTVLRSRMRRLETQVGEMVQFAAEYKRLWGKYPQTLDQFQLKDLRLRRFVKYQRIGPDDFVIEYQPCSRGPSDIYHGYSPNEGYWFIDD